MSFARTTALRLPSAARQTVSRPSQVVGRLPRNVQFNKSSAGRRFNSTQSHSKPVTEQAGGLPAGLVGGLAGGGVVLLAIYAYYRSSGLATIVDTTKQTKAYLAETTEKVKKSAPAPDQALDWLHETANEYAKFVPGGKGYVNTVFKDIDTVREQHGEEVNEIVNDAYKKIQKLANQKGVSWDGATQSWNVFEDAFAKLGKLAADAGSDVLDNHPELKQKVGGGLDQLKQLGEQYGPEAKKQVDDVNRQIKEILAGGFSIASANKIRQLVQDKTAEVKKLGDAAWDKGLESAKPYLEKNPKVKELIEKNKDALKEGNTTELWNRLKDATSSNSDEITKYLQETAEQGKKKLEKSTGKNLGDLSSMLSGILPAGVAESANEIIPKLQKLQEAAGKHGDEAEKIAKDTYAELRDLLSKKLKEVEGLGENVKEDAKKEIKK